MLTGVRIYSSDTVWRQILADFGATVLDVPNAAYINFDELPVVSCMTPLQLKTLILNAADADNILRRVFNSDVHLPRIQSQIVVCLYKTDGMTTTELKDALGYAPDVTTHVVETAIYQLRKAYGREFIKNTNGVYRLGKL